MSENKNLLFHCCCAPCSLSCIKQLKAQNTEPHLFWFNPNIHPCGEYKSRRDCLFSFAKNENLKLESVDEYGLRLFLNEVFPDDENRCKKCYYLRLEKTALFASQNGYSSFSTSLLVSPYQNHEEIIQAGKEAALKYNIEFFYRDFRPFFREGQTEARLNKMYMQKYCGCIFSELLGTSGDKNHA
ncbi:MAG: epoxyqueuosine reductase QueH [Treponema sp.]|nr:epoxyqueuosine reductase QueH [Treponema sp.]